MSDTRVTKKKIHKRFTTSTIRRYCDVLCRQDPSLRKIIDAYGYPEIFLRTAGFQALLRLILEQQVSLMSAKAAWDKLKARAGEITPEAVLALSDDELRQCYFSRQKARYVRILANAVADRELLLHELTELPDDEIRNRLVRLTGIGAWTADSYLLLSLNRFDIFPIGDIALVNSIKKIKKLPAGTPRGKILKLSEKWKPYRSIATLIFWHAYIIDKKIEVDRLKD